MSYTIRLQNCAFFARHGVLPEETSIGQRFYVDAELMVEDTGAVEADEIEGTVHYGEVFASIEANVTGPPVKLIEHLAFRIGTAILHDFPLVECAAITVRKPSAPIEGVLDHVEVTVTSKRAS